MTTTATRARRLLGVVTVACLLAGLAVAATARPVAAADSLGTYSLTFAGTAAGRGGGVGASGGLVTFSGGPGDVSGRLDAAPSAAAQASSIEPGTMVRLVTGQLNDAAGEQVVGEPTTARAEFPGATSEDDATQAGPDPAGPLQVAGGHARAIAAGDRAVAEAGVARFTVTGSGTGSVAAGLARALAAWRVAWAPGPGTGDAAAQPLGAPTADPPLLEVRGAFGDGRAVTDQAAGTVSATVRVGADRVTVLDQVVLRDVVGTATVGAVGDDRTASADLAAGEVTVGGIPVRVGDDGVVVADQQVVAGADVDAATAQLNAALEAAGIHLRMLDTRETTEGTRAAADTGGIGIRITTPAAQGVPRNDLELVLGGATATVFAEPPPAPLTPAPGGTAEDATDDPRQGADGAAPPPGATTTRGGSAPVPGGAVQVPDGSPVATSPAAPQVAPESPAAPTAAPDMVVAGRRMTARTAYAGFAAWLLFTSTIPMLGTAWLHRRGRA